jgi:hypothetical protein
MNGWQEETTTWFAVDTTAGALLPGPPRPPVVGETLVDAIPLRREGLDLGFISGTLSCVIIYFLLLATLQSRGRGVLPALFNCFYRERHAGQLVEKRILPNRLPFFCALCLSFVALSLFAAYLTRGGFAPVTAALYFGFLLVYHFSLLGVVASQGWIFNVRGIAREVAVNLRIYHAVPGIVLSPLVFWLFYARPVVERVLLFAIVGTLALYLLLRCVRWVKILFKHGISIFYLILYLCALELLPLLVLYKALGGSFREDV